MAKIGESIKSKLQESQGRYMDDLCDNLVWQNVTVINTATSMSIAECGTVVLGAAVGTEQASGAGFNVSLPTPKSGLWYNFVLRPPSIANNADAAITVTATSDGSTAANIAVGNVRGHGDDNGANVVAGVDILTFVHNKATCGDQASFICDGTNWHVSAVYDADGSITLA
jgi:hypothetical protein